jgi:hypothetical protein
VFVCVRARAVCVCAHARVCVWFAAHRVPRRPVYHHRLRNVPQVHQPRLRPSRPARPRPARPERTARHEVRVPRVVGLRRAAVRRGPVQDDPD